MLKKSFFAIIIIFLFAFISNAQVPQLVNYQAILTDAQGNMINGVRSVQFSIYDTETGGDALWSETQNVIVTEGLCNVLLGAVTLIPHSVFSGGDKYFSLKIGNDPEMTPRKRLVSVGYAFHANKSDSLNEFAAPDFVRSLDGVTPDDGNIDLVAGSNVTIKPDDKNNSITISASGGSAGDDLGNHTATQNIQLNGHYLSGDGGDEGVYITNNGNVGIGTTNPLSMLSVGGNGSSHSVIFSQATGDIFHGGRFETDHSGGYGISCKATGSYGRGVYGYTTSSTGRGVYGEALNSGKVRNYGGYFTASGDSGRGVYGYTTGIDGYGVYGEALGGSGRGVYGKADGSHGRGVAGYADGSSGHAVYGEAANDGDATNYGGYFTARGSHGRGVYGIALKSGNVTNYGGYFKANGNSGRGVAGYAPGSDGYGVYGEALYGGYVTNYGGYFTANGNSGRGVYGEASNNDGVENYGGYFKASGSAGRGVYGEASGSSGLGVEGYAEGSQGRGVLGRASYKGDVTNYGGHFTANGNSGRGVYGEASNNDGVDNYGGYFKASGSAGRGVYGEASGSSGYGVFGFASGSDGYGVYGHARGSNGIGVYGYTRVDNTNSKAIVGHADASLAYAGWFIGKVHINGHLSKSSGSFKIDHPLDPENKYLYHSFVESPDMMNIYNGNVVTDANGYATVDLPEWFEALNKDFRYQLTVIGEFAQAIVSDEISNNQFSVKTDKPNIKVSWQVTGVRQDAFANANRIPVEEMKEDKERGKYLHPEAFNMPKTAGLDYEERME